MKKEQGAAQAHIIYTRETLDWKKERKSQEIMKIAQKTFIISCGIYISFSN